MLRRYAYFLGGKMWGPRFYNMRIINCIRSLAVKYPNFIDVRAHHGEILLHVANLFDKCIAVEPLPSSFKSLMLNIHNRGLKNIIAFQVALGEEDTMKTLYVPTKDTSGASLAKISSNMREGPKVIVKMLDEIVSKVGLNGQILIKIDVQGHELHVLKGARKTLDRPCAIICEFWPYGMVRSGYNVRDFIRFMDRKGYYPYDLKLTPIGFGKLDSIGLQGINDPWVVMDCLFLKVDSSSQTAFV